MCSGEQVRWRGGGHRRGEEEVSGAVVAGADGGARWRAPVDAHWRGGAGDRAVGRWRAPVVASGGGLQRSRSGAGGHAMGRWRALVTAL